jgi:hypothetical protein
VEKRYERGYGGEYRMGFSTVKSKGLQAEGPGGLGQEVDQKTK